MSNPQTSIEWNCEEVIIQKLKANAAFANQDIRHWDKDARAIIEAIIVRCEKANKDLDGVEGWRGSVTINFSSGTLTEAEADAISNLIGETVYLNDPTFFADVAALVPDLYFFSVEPDSQTTRTDNKKLRRRIMTIPVIAKLTL